MSTIDALRRIVRRPKKVPVAVPAATLLIGLLSGSGGAYAALVVTGTMIKDGTVTARDLGTNSVATSELANNSVTSAKIVVNGVTASDIANGAVSTGEVVNESLTANDIKGDAIGSSEILNGSVGAAELAAGGVGADAIANDAVRAAEIQAAAVGSSEIANGSIVAGDLDASFLATIVNGGSTVYLPNGDNTADPWNADNAMDNVVDGTVVTYVSASDPCTTGDPISVQGVQYNSAIDANSALFSPTEFTDSGNPTHLPVPVRTEWYYQSGHRFSVRMVGVTPPHPNVSDIGFVVRCG